MNKQFVGECGCMCHVNKWSWMSDWKATIYEEWFGPQNKESLTTIYDVYLY